MNGSRDTPNHTPHDGGASGTHALLARISRRRVLRALGAVATLAACNVTSEATDDVSPPRAPGSEDAGSLGSEADAGASEGDGADTSEVYKDQLSASQPDGSELDGSHSDAAQPDAAQPDAIAGVKTIPKPISPITPNSEYFITTCCGDPTFDVAKWSIALSDRGKALGTISKSFLDGLKAKDREHTLECISASPYDGTISNAIWTGLPLLDIFAELGVTVPTGVSVMKFTAADDYTTAVPVSDLQRPIWLVWKMNGQPLPMAHGFPARLLIPDRYGMKCPKWITALDFREKPFDGYWESTGWSKEANVLPNTLVRAPFDKSTLPAGLIRVQGTAFAGSDPIAAVHVRIGKGPWLPTVIDYSPGPDVWTLWHFDWQVAQAGTYTLTFRCTTKSGEQSLIAPKIDLNGWSGSMQVTYTIT